MLGIKKRIKDLLNQKFTGTNCFLVDVVVPANQKIQVFVDCIPNLKISQCVELSRYLEFFLEDEGLVNENYTLEVSSPGMGRPFKVLQQYQKNIEKDLIIVLESGVKVEGKLKSMSEDALVLDEYLPISKKKHKKMETRPIIIPFNEIKSTKKKITF